MNDINKVDCFFYGVNKKIACTIPPKIYKADVSWDIQFELNKNDVEMPVTFDLNFFLSRFVAGDKSLKESRNISRKRLALVSSKIGFIDPEAQALREQMHRYSRAKEMMLSESEITLELLLEVHKLVEPVQSNSGVIRTKPNWIGGKNPDTAYYVSPPPELVPDLLDDWLLFINDINQSIEVRAIIGHNQLLNIHPFSDGNGRTSRLVLHSLLERKYGEIIHPSIYRLNKEFDTYVEAISDSLSVSSFTRSPHKYWNENMSFCEDIKLAMLEVLKSTMSTIKSKLIFSIISQHTQDLIDYLWSQPVFCEADLMSHFGWDYFESQKAIKELIDLRLIIPRKIKYPENAIIYDCPIIINTLTSLDSMVFEYQ